MDINNEYNIYIEEDFSKILEYLIINSIDYRNIFIITDENVGEIYLKEIKDIFSESNIFTYTLEAGEKSKNINNILNIYEKMLFNILDRKTLIVALGGGVVGDIAGFVASTYMRGIPFIQVPTTLLSQVDSSIGGKVGIDFLEKKNIIGSFYNPQMVYINISTLKTLPIRQFSNGMAEVIKHGYIIDKKYLNFIFMNKQRILNFDTNAIKEMVYTSCKIKSKIVSLDEKENSIRQILNFGHTFGHSIETCSEFSILHGEAVALGMICSLYISYRKGYISSEDISQAKGILKYFDLYKKVNINCENIYKNMIYDKKNKNGKINIVMLRSIGEAFVTENITQQIIKEAIDYILEV